MLWALAFLQIDALPDISSVPTDLVAPAVTDGAPAPGKRVRMTAPEWRATEVHHTLYLPVDWKRGRKYPVIVDYAGNGPYKNKFGDESPGTVEGSNLGYGLSGGRGFLWLSLPYVNAAEKRNQISWWGDVDATVDYCVRTVPRVVEEFGGDPSSVILTGFSRGAIACNFIGLHNDAIADLWLAFLPYSHYDGVRTWNYDGSDRASALARLQRLKGRAQFLIHEGSIDPAREYLQSAGVAAPFTLLALPFRNHNERWTFRDIPARRQAREWLREVIETKPGTFAVRGVVRDERGRPLRGVRVESGPGHWTVSRRDGRFVLPGLVRGERAVSADGVVIRVSPDAAEANFTLPRVRSR